MKSKKKIKKKIRKKTKNARDFNRDDFPSTQQWNLRTEEKGYEWHHQRLEICESASHKTVKWENTFLEMSD